jgi:tetratricopeptide (TPR) repeat protein
VRGSAERRALRDLASADAAVRPGSGTTDATTAAALFERANLARRRGRLAQASGLYQDLRARFPRSAEALLSVALSARLQLDDGELQAALEGFRRYLRSDHRVLREQALAGVAIALLRLDRPLEADAAFAALLRAYPDSAYARLARRRGSGAP